MSPHDWDQFGREKFNEATFKFGWSRVKHEDYEEDGYGYNPYGRRSIPRIREGWANDKGEWIITDDDITEKLAEALIKISENIPIK